jgi:hypothetical protein
MADSRYKTGVKEASPIWATWDVNIEGRNGGSEMYVKAQVAKEVGCKIKGMGRKEH